MNMHTLRNILFLILLAATGLSAQSEWKVKDASPVQYNPDNSEVAELEIYPNPTIDYVFVKSDESTASYILTNLIGKIIHRGPIVQGQAIIDLTAQHKGIYIVKIFNYDNKRITTRKIIKE